MADECIQIVAMSESGETEEKYEIYETDSDMYCVVGLDNNQQTSGKTSGSKTRYKQSYREAWESMRDFKGWLSNVPGNTSKAYCKLCQKELHCHRLSLLKHKVTFKHQKKEEEQKLAKLRGEKSEPPAKQVKDIQTESTDAKNSAKEKIVFEIERENKGTEKSTILSEPTTSHECKCSHQHDKGEVESKNGFLSTHVLDISRGVPGGSVHLVLYKLINGRWTLLLEGETNSEGRHHFSDLNEKKFSEGRYKLHYDVEEYFEKQSQETIFPFVEVVFDVKNLTTHYHIPLLLSPYGYSTYKGS